MLGFVAIATARPMIIEIAVYNHCLNNRTDHNPAPVGAAIGRPSVKIRSDVKQHASAKWNTSIVTGRDTEKTTI